MVDVEKLKALALAATKGPWMRLFGERTVYDRMEDGCRGNAIVRADVAFSMQDANNLDFIAVANPAAVLELIAEVERLRAELAAGAAREGGVTNSKPNSTAPTVEVDERAFDDAWKQEVASNGGIAIGADYRHWMQKGWRAALASRPPAEAAGERLSIADDPEFHKLLAWVIKDVGEPQKSFHQKNLARFLDTWSARSAGTIERNLSATIGAMQADIDQLKADLKEARSAAKDS